MSNEARRNIVAPGFRKLSWMYSMRSRHLQPRYPVLPPPSSLNEVKQFGLKPCRTRKPSSFTSSGISETVGRAGRSLPVTVRAANSVTNRTNIQCDDSASVKVSMSSFHPVTSSA
jgi:hypothetical protein